MDIHKELINTIFNVVDEDTTISFQWIYLDDKLYKSLYLNLDIKQFTKLFDINISFNVERIHCDLYYYNNEALFDYTIFYSKSRMVEPITKYKIKIKNEKLIYITKMLEHIEKFDLLVL